MAKRRRVCHWLCQCRTWQRLHLRSTGKASGTRATVPTFFQSAFRIPNSAFPFYFFPIFCVAVPSLMVILAGRPGNRAQRPATSLFVISARTR